MRLASYVKRSPLGIYYLRVVFPQSLRAKLAGRRDFAAGVRYASATAG